MTLDTLFAGLKDGGSGTVVPNSHQRKRGRGEKNENLCVDQPMVDNLMSTIFTTPDI